MSVPNAELERRLEQGGKLAASVLVDLVQADPRKGDSPEARTDARARRRAAMDVVRARPELGLAVLQSPKEITGLNDSGAAKILDELVGFYEDPDEARELLDNNIQPDRQVELLQARGDLPAAAADTVRPDVVLAAIFTDIEDGRLESMLVLMSWAMKLKDRDDWEDILRMEVGELTVFDWLVGAVALHAKQVDSVTADMWVEVGVDPDEGHEAFEELDAAGVVLDIDPEDLEEVKVRLGELRREAEAEPILADKAASAVEDLAEADELDF